MTVVFCNPSTNRKRPVWITRLSFEESNR